jgi:hypothetical protein
MHFSDFKSPGFLAKAGMERSKRDSLHKILKDRIVIVMAV